MANALKKNIAKESVVTIKPVVKEKTTNKISATKKTDNKLTSKNKNKIEDIEDTSNLTESQRIELDFLKHTKEIEKEVEEVLKEDENSNNIANGYEEYAEENKEIFYRDSVNAYLNTLSLAQPLQPTETIELFKKISKSKDAEAIKIYKNRIFEGNLKLVVSFAKKYIQSCNSMSFEDLCQEGMFGMQKAIENYNYKLGWAFSTYASYWIKQTITRGLADKDKMIRIPVHANETYYKIKTLMAGGEEFDPKVLAKKFNTSESTIKDIMAMMQQPVSLDAPLQREGEEGDSFLVDFVKDSGLPIEETVVNTVMFEQMVDVMKEVLKPREFDVMCLRFGISDGKTHTLDYIGKVFNVTRERIRQIENKSIRKLRIAVKRRKIVDIRAFG